MFAVALQVQDRVDHVLQEFRPGDLAVLGHVADQDERGPGLLGLLHQLGGHGADLAHRAGDALGQRRGQGLDRVHDEHLGRFHPFEHGQGVLDLVGGHGQQPRPEQAEPPGAGFQLGQGLLAREIDRGVPEPRLAARQLQEQGGLADARLAAEQNGRARDQPGAEQPVQGGQAGGPRAEVLALQIFQGLRSLLGRGRAHRGRGLAAHGHGLERVPFLAGGALALPARGLCAAGGATVGFLGFHGVEYPVIRRKNPVPRMSGRQ